MNTVADSILPDVNTLEGYILGVQTCIGSFPGRIETTDSRHTCKEDSFLRARRLFPDLDTRRYAESHFDVVYVNIQTNGGVVSIDVPVYWRGEFYKDESCIGEKFLEKMVGKFVRCKINYDDWHETHLTESSKREYVLRFFDVPVGVDAMKHISSSKQKPFFELRSSIVSY